MLLSMRDDFLMRCHEQRRLRPGLRAADAAPGPLTREGLRRALVEPASQRGYRFEDEALVDEMVEAVEGARGALPLLAFAVSRLWERRDREREAPDARGLPRRSAASRGRWPSTPRRRSSGSAPSGRRPSSARSSATSSTAQGTRAVLDREELLSALPGSGRGGGRRCSRLVDARLLTSYETEATRASRPPPRRDRARVAALGLAAAGALADAGRRRGAASRPAPPGGAPVGRAGEDGATCSGPARRYRDYRAWRERYPGRSFRGRGGLRRPR